MIVLAVAALAVAVYGMCYGMFCFHDWWGERHGR